MKGHRPVFWSQGLFLQPQHFQAADEAASRQIELLRQYALPYFWGIRKLVFSGSPSSQSISIESLEAVFPSGAAINVPFDAALAPLALDENWPAPDKPGILYLGLALPKTGGANAALDQGSEFTGTRFIYSEEPDSMPDQYSNSAPAQVQLLKYAPILIKDIDKARYSDFECIPIALLRRSGERVEFDPDFIAPIMCLNASYRFAAIISEIYNMALSCASRLSGYKTTVSGGTPDMNFLLNFNALTTLNRYIPLLNHLQSYQDIHPWHLYGLLCTFAGELSSYFEEIDCLGRSAADLNGIPNYHHENPRACFEPLCSLITSLLNKLGQDRSKTLHLLPAGSYFSADIPDDFISSSGRYWIFVQAATLNDTLADEIPALVKLGVRDRLNVIIAKAVSGVTLTKTPNPPPGFLKSPNTAWYSVDIAHPLWKEITEKRKISLFWEGSPDNTDVRLIATGW